MKPTTLFRLFPRPRKGFTLFELIVVVSIVAVLAGALLSRVWFYEEQAEEAALEQVAAALQGALTLQYGTLLASGRAGEAELLTTENPMNWLAKKPPNYAGEFFDPALQAIARGSWAFDLKSRDLIYRVDHAEHFAPGKDGIQWVRYHVRPIYERSREAGGKESRIVAGIVLEPVASYRWFERRL